MSYVFCSRTGQQARSTLDRTGGQSSDEEPLKGEEDDEGQDHGEERTSGENLPVLATTTDKLCQPNRHYGNIRSTAEEDNGHQEVVPHPEELENGE